MSSKTSYEAGDVIIEQLDLVDLKGGKSSYSLFEQFETINIFESIKSPVITGVIEITDGINLRENYPILADKCKIILKFKNQVDLPSRTFDLLITEVKNIAPDPNAQYARYQLILCSKEILDNSKRLFTTAMRKKKIDEYIKYIMTDIITTSKQITLDPSGTKGVQDLDLIQMKPFQSIDFLRRRAVSVKYKSSTYSFFENKSGFVFSPVEYLFERKDGRIKDAEFFFDTDTKQNVKNITFRNILAFNHVTQQSTAKMVQEGALKNVTTSLDLRTRTYQTNTFDLVKEFPNFKFPGKTSKINSANFESEYSKMPAITNFFINTSKNPDDFLLDKIGFNKAFVELLTQNILRIMTWGDSVLSAGYRIQCQVPAIDGQTNARGKKVNEPSSFVSGEYLISSIRHIFHKLQNKHRYNTSMELIKGTYGETTRSN
jgi:hypothetical protein